MALTRKSKKENQVAEVAPVITGPVKLHWKKVGGGVLRIDGQIIKPNQEFWATMESIPKSFMDCLICLEGTKKIEEVKAADKKERETPEELYTIESAGSGLFNLVNANGKPINDQPLSKKEAKELKVTLET